MSAAAAAAAPAAAAGPGAAATVVRVDAAAPPPPGELTLYSMPICPFCQRVDTLLAMKGQSAAARYAVCDLSVPRPGWLLERTGGTTSLPVLELADGRVLKESLVIMDYLDAALPGPRAAAADPYDRAVEAMLVALVGEWFGPGYALVMNQDESRRAGLVDAYLAQVRRLSVFLERHAARGGPFLRGAEFGYAEAAAAPFWQRFWFLDYYEGGDVVPAGDPAYERARAWRDACVSHPLVAHITREEVVKVYYDYAKGLGNGALPPGRAKSTFALDPDWRGRPMPPADKYTGRSATDAELGLV